MNSVTKRPCPRFLPDIHPIAAVVGALFAILAALILQPVSPASADGDHEALRSQLLILDGEVIELGTTDGEGALVLATATLRSHETSQTEWRILLAPAEVLEKIEFTINLGDHLRARVFEDPSNSHLVQKVWNVQTRNYIRLRSLYRIPFWDNDGQWQGSERADCPSSPWQQDPGKDPEPPQDQGSSDE